MEHFDNLDDYIADLKAKLQKNAQCGNTHYNLGVAYLSRRDFMEAEREFLEAVANSPKMAEGYVQLGGIALQRDDMEGCLNYNIQATQARPFFAVPWGNIGFVQLQMGDVDKAHKSLKKALKLDPEFVQAQATMSSVLISMGEYEEGDKLLKTILDKYPNFGPAWNNKAIIDAHFEKWDDAKSCIAKATEYGFEVPDDFRKEIESK
jgi:tetratricopeptide (TPR) repeat protein